jgi:type I restriction enzyme S subunit
MRAMKDSGIKWIGEIPEEWEVKKLKYLGDLNSNGVDKKIVDGETLYKSVHYMNVYNNSLKEINNSDDYLIISTNDLKAKSCTLEKGDVLFTNSSETPEDMGHSTVVYEKLYNTLFGYHLMRFRPKIELYLKFEKYLFGSYYMRKWFEFRSVGMTRYGISYSEFAEALIILPILSEQQSIADYLDRKCELIDNTIEKQKSVIEKLKLFKQSIITEVVTKGLDPTVKMKTSGIEWIGDIPETWEVSAVKYKFNVFNGSTPKSENGDYWDGNIVWITPAEMSEDIVEIIDSKRKITKEGLQSCGTTLVPPKSIIVSNRAPIGQICIAGVELCTNQGCKSLASKVEVDYKYIYHYFSVQAKTLNMFGRGTTFLELSTYDLANYKIPLPQPDEQKAIADYLDCKSAYIDDVINGKQKLIDKLTDYKKSLIYECVTGKREVI